MKPVTIESVMAVYEAEAATLRARVAVLEAAARALVEERERVSGLLEYEAWPMLQRLYTALRAALAPRSERREGEPDDGSMDCSCGRVTLDFFAGTHSMLTKEGERFISTNHRRDRCDREEVIPDPPPAPAWTMQGCPECHGTGREGTGTPSGEGGEDFRECFRCQGTGFVPFPAPPAAPKAPERGAGCPDCGDSGLIFDPEYVERTGNWKPCGLCPEGLVRAEEERTGTGRAKREPNREAGRCAECGGSGAVVGPLGSGMCQPCQGSGKAPCPPSR